MAFLLLFAIFLFSLMDAVVKDLLSSYSPIQILWARFTSQVLVSLFISSNRLTLLFHSRYTFMHIMRSCLLFATTICFFTALTGMQLSQATAVFQINPVIIVVLSTIILREKVGILCWFCVIFGMLGALLVIRPDLPDFSFIMILPLIAAICFAGFPNLPGN